MKTWYTYITSNYTRTTLYVGYAGDLKKRIKQHKGGYGAIFTLKYQCKYLLYYEVFDTKAEAKYREKNLKNWHRDWKFNLIRASNPDLSDLSEKIEQFSNEKKTNKKASPQVMRKRH